MADVPKGPWWLDEQYDGLSVSWTRSRAICCADPDTGTIDPPAFVAHTTRGWQDGGVSNARLIAAAPELYHALRDVLRIARAASGVTGNTARIAKAEAALAKAKGE